MATVVITQNYRIQDAITEALQNFPLKELIPNKFVAVKPNDTWASKDEKTAVTQPETLRGVLEVLKLHAPRQLIVTGGSGAGVTRDIFETAGLMEVVDDEEAEFFDHNQAPFREVALEYSPRDDVDGPQKSVMVNPKVLQYEVLVSLAQLKLHETATVTLSLKNIAMSFPAADYYGHPRWSQTHENSFFCRYAFLYRGHGKTISDQVGDRRGPSGDDCHRPDWRPSG
jgi:uncharacterized protein (DUF362 family)